MPWSITREGAQRRITLTGMREECVGVLLDHFVQQWLPGAVARVAPSHRDEGGKPVRHWRQASQVTNLSKVLNEFV